MTAAARTVSPAMPVTGTPAGGPAVQGFLTPGCPPGWDAHLKRCEGGFFHSPTGSELGCPGGEPVYLRLVAGTEVVGIGAGMRRSCRLSHAPRHVSFPTFPALAPGLSRKAALDALIRAVREADGAELMVESFDATWTADATSAPSMLRSRDEYIVSLDRAPAEIWSNLSSGHRRQVRKADRSGFRIEMPEGEAARSLLITVQEVAATRAAARGNGFTVNVPPLIGMDSAGDRPWGATMFAAWQESTPLAAALVGWANRRAFYVMGGSTPAGYERGASVWLHWQIITRLAEMGFVTYNLGGASATAPEPGDAAHGLYRFKTGFGAGTVPCRSMQWNLSATHARVHQLVRWLATTSSSLQGT